MCFIYCKLSQIWKSVEYIYTHLCVSGALPSALGGVEQHPLPTGCQKPPGHGSHRCTQTWSYVMWGRVAGVKTASVDTDEQR